MFALALMEFTRAEIPLAVATGVLLLCAVMVTARVVLGPTPFDRLLALGQLGILGVVIISLMGFVAGDPGMYLDVALMFALLSFMGTLAALKFVRNRRIG
jgi:multicomponent Na+:H+ antiporter subunit F